LSFKRIRKVISKYTAGVRYKTISGLIKYLTPNLYFKISLMRLIGERGLCEFVPYTLIPRPSVRIMRNYFGNHLVSGAEVGVLKGDNAVSILNELNIKKLYLIDIWDDYKDSDSRYKNKENYNIVLNKFKRDKKVEIVKGFSKKGSERIENNSLDFVYIDGNHKYKYVYNDMVCWYPKIREGGILAGHDVFNFIDVFKAVKDYCSKNRIVFKIELPDWYLIKNNGG